MTDNQIRELFDTVPFFVDNPIEEGLLPALCNPFKRRFGPYRNLLN